MAKKKAPKKPEPPVKARHLASGEEWEVPREVYAAGKAAAWIEEQIADRQQQEAIAKRQAADADAAAEQARLDAIAPEKTREDLLAEVDALQTQLRRLNREHDDVQHRMGLKDRQITELSALVDLHGLHRQSFDTVAEKVADHQAQQRHQTNRKRDRNALLFEKIRQGQHVDLSEFDAPLPPEQEVE